MNRAPTRAATGSGGRTWPRRGGAAVVLATVVAAAVAVCAAAAGAVPWRVVSERVIARGAAPSTPTGFVVRGRGQGLAFRPWLRPEDAARLARVDYTKLVAVAVVAPAGCWPGAAVGRVDRTSTGVSVTVVVHPPSPAVATCEAVIPAYWLLTIPRSAFGASGRSLPQRALVRVVHARA